MRRLLAACVVALLASVVVSLAAGGSEEMATGSGARTHVFYPNGKLVGWVTRYAPREWDASNSYNSYITMSRKGAYVIYEGHMEANAAWPSPRGERHRYVTAGGSPHVFTWVSPTRWNVYWRGRLVAYTRGGAFGHSSDGVAAALAFATWGDGILPD